MKKAKKPHKQHAVKGKLKSSSLSYAHTKKHHKPFRFRHVGLVGLALLIGLSSVFQLGYYYGKSQTANQPIVSNETQESTTVSVRSAYGFSLAYDSEILSASATESSTTGDLLLGESELHKNRQINSISLSGSGKAGVASRDRAVRLTVKVNQDEEVFAGARANSPDTLSDAQVAADIYEVESNGTYEVKVLSQTSEQLNGIDTVKRVFEYTPNFGRGEARAYSVQWSGVVQGRAFTMHIEGLVGDSSIPAAFQSVFDSLSFLASAGGDNVLGLSTSANLIGFGSSDTQQFQDDYAIERVSPAVVKIYHATCGTLVAFNKQLGEETCNVNTGSGFFVSSDGYIATNGHVVDYSAEDAFVSSLLSNSSLLSSFLEDVVGLTSEQIDSLISDPAVFAALIAEIYELDDDVIRLSNESHTYFVALGKEPLLIETQEDAYSLRNKVDSSKLVKAKLIVTDYASKDLYVIGSGDEAGFSSSDVALLKAPVEDSPYVRLFDGTVTQNMDITVVGFPTDADNSLTDNTKLSTSVTNGVISAIRDSAGGKHKVYQSDADASGGNSGGPAFSPSGMVLGLVTYRFKNESQQDAAKSYIRDINDLSSLANSQNIVFSQDGNVQSNWEMGLELYANNRFTKSLELFKDVQNEYPGHRLAATYIANAEEAIKDGKDVEDFPILAATAALIAGFGLALGIALVVRHHGHYRLFKHKQQYSDLADVQHSHRINHTAHGSF